MRPTRSITALSVLYTLFFCSISSEALTHRPVVSRVAAQYPELARRMHVLGTVIIRATVQPDGSVSSAHLESGHALLAPAALKAVSQWRFVPAADVDDVIIELNFER